MASDSIQYLPLNQLQPNPLQPRGPIKKEELDELIESFKTYGILEPLVIAHTPAGYQIIAGERRWRAAKEAGLTEVPVLIKKTTPKRMLEMALVENVQRIDLSAMERAQAFQQLIREFGYSIGQVAERVSKSSSYISSDGDVRRPLPSEGAPAEDAAGSDPCMNARPASPVRTIRGLASLSLLDSSLRRTPNLYSPPH